MEVAGVENVGCDDLKLEPPFTGQLPTGGPLTEQPSSSSLRKQNSILSLTLDEIQYRSGKTFGSMNMDEFLASIWNVDENQSLPCQNEAPRANTNAAGQSSLARQGSFSIPTPLCNKTVDEVWDEIHKGQGRTLSNENNTILNDHEPPRRQQTFGEMTLEDFLVKAGVVQESPLPKATPPPQPPVHKRNLMDPSPSLDAGLGMRSASGYGYPNTPQGGGNNFPGNGYPGFQMYPPTARYMGECASSVMNERCQSLAEAVGLKSRRIIDGPPEVVIERRQRRMIKNRESAARSRARKQAYTVELEVELNQLKEENEKLKKILTESEHKRRKEMMMKWKLPTKAEKAAEKFKSMRRTASSAW
ncbi:ABSCISIC ACID-INSENSITIVE 5-like protein 1 [Rhodamnia argentea]|uniref:ABSCISIC ACID-INSENSITIVE 5-like protein 1 n=1 Tax=Rhodamnia argentea TaxID=178133 RepID=A0ABM3HLM2_9MYRT|nr:ABSCISIC ACID-INSENSITIVE 5-like protein 1 [Rhodamnia argentea]XP_048137494.1 ABSCISIC ACID-INSENSITIVE 5-like protein 1 [Rhodamnia argentea]